MNTLKGLVLMGLLTFLSACTGGPSLDHYKGSTPPLNLQEYFTGPIKAWGVVQGDVGTLDEDFKYYDGETQLRTWTIKRIADNKYEGTAGDILGKADGEVNGGAMRWAYQMDLPVGDKTYKITFDDWMFLMNDGILINRSYLKKFGFTVAELTLFMQKQDQQ
jgi:hypothetical protein